MKTNLKDDFEHKEWWEMIFVKQFGVNMDEMDEF